MIEYYEPLDFDRLSQLAVNKPEVLDRYLRLKVNQIISRARPEEKRYLQQLQFRIEGIRRRSTNPLASCIKISGMMHDELDHLREALNGSIQPSPLPERINPDSSARNTDNVIPLFKTNAPHPDQKRR